MSELDKWLKDGLRSELELKHHLKALSDNLRQQLQVTERRMGDELDKRIRQDALISTDIGRESGDNNKLNHRAKHVGMKRSTSTSVLTSEKETLRYAKQTDRLNSSSPAWVSSPDWTHCSLRCCTLTPTHLRKEKEAEAECQKQFCALSVPSHVVQPLYQEMMELREKERKQGHEQRRDFLLSMQKPFSFEEREKGKREKLTATLNQDSGDHYIKKTTASRTPQNDSSKSELKDQELCRQVPTLATVKPEKSTWSGAPTLRTAERARKENVAFLYEKHSFKPKIIHQVPDFNRLHKSLQTEGLRKTQRKEDTRCQPFNLRTSALRVRRCGMSAEDSQVPKTSHLSRSKSLGALTSLSADTLPTYITDATRKRRTAIRKSMELRESKNQESVTWLKKYNTRSQALQKTVALQAKLLDPHSSLKEVFNEKVAHHLQADQQRMRDYVRELRDIKARVSQRPFLFQQVKQANAKAQAEQTYRNKLKQVGLEERFVEEKGAGTSTSSTSEADTDENDAPSREENVDDGEKIEDVEEKSVKSKGEEMS